MKELILKKVLKNAYDFNGSVNPKVVLGQVLKENPELKKKVHTVLQQIEKTANEVRSMSKDEIKSQLEKIAPKLLVEKKEQKDEGPLKFLKNAIKGKLKVRIAPSPSGPMHIGHAYGVLINSTYARMYEGSLIVRIEDTNPENIYGPAYSLIEEDSNWITKNNVAQVVVQSSRLGMYYDYAEELVRLGKAYVCDCNNDIWREMKAKGQTCSCRILEIKEQQTRYAKMFSEYAEGEVILRLKTDIKHKNPAMRDFGIMRIVEHVHPKTGKEHRVWPLMVFSVAIDDHELGITHVLNGKDHADNAKKETIIMNYLGWEAPHYQHWGRINFEGFKLSTTKTKFAISQGEYSGWDDIRLATLIALRRRGYQAQAFQKFALEIGLSLNDKTVSWNEFWKMINAFNRDLVEPTSNRYFFVDNPLEIEIEGVPGGNVELELHPDFPERGYRILKTGDKYLVSKVDFEKLIEGKVHRLIDAFNFRIEKGKIVFVSKSYEEYQDSNEKGMIIHWLPADDDNLEVQVLLEDHSTMKGFGEIGMKNLKVGDIVQLQRRFFARVDAIENGKIKFWYLHK